MAEGGTFTVYDSDTHQPLTVTVNAEDAHNSIQYITSDGTTVTGLSQAQAAEIVHVSSPYLPKCFLVNFNSEIAIESIYKQISLLKHSHIMWHIISWANIYHWLYFKNKILWSFRLIYLFYFYCSGKNCLVFVLSKKNIDIFNNLEY